MMKTNHQVTILTRTFRNQLMNQIKQNKRLDDEVKPKITKWFYLALVLLVIIFITLIIMYINKPQEESRVYDYTNKNQGDSYTTSSRVVDGTYGVLDWVLNNYGTVFAIFILLYIVIRTSSRRFLRGMI